MNKQTIDILIEAGKATPGPPLGPALSCQIIL
jgi:ribosomal protein L11